MGETSDPLCANIKGSGSLINTWTVGCAVLLPMSQSGRQSGPNTAVGCLVSEVFLEPCKKHYAPWRAGELSGSNRTKQRERGALLKEDVDAKNQQQQQLFVTSRDDQSQGVLNLVSGDLGADAAGEVPTAESPRGRGGAAECFGFPTASKHE